MSIRWKSLLALAAVIVGVNLLLYFSARLIILDSYLELEQVKALQDMQRVRSVLQDDLSHLGLMTHNIAHSEQAYKFLTGEEEGAFLDRFAAPNHLHVDTHLIAFVDRKGRLHHGHYMEPGEREDGVLPANIEQRLREMPFLWRHNSHAERFEGVLLFPGGAMLVSSSPISVPDRPTEVAGALIMGSYLETGHVNLLGEISHLSLQGLPADSTAGLAGESGALLPLVGSPISLEIADEDRLLGRIHLSDVFGRPVKILQAEIPRDIYRQGLATIRYFTRWSLVLSIAFGVLVYVVQGRLALMRQRREESENLLRFLVEQAPDAFFLFDLQRGFVDVNRSACESLQYSREEFMGCGWSILGPEVAALDKPWRQLAPGEGMVTRSRLKRRDDTLLPVEVSVSRFEVHGRRLLLALARDIRERLKNEQSLRESEQRYRKLSHEFSVLLDAIADSIVLFSPAMKVVWGNRAASQLVGMAEDSLLGRPCTEVLQHRMGQLCKECPVRTTFQTGEMSERIEHDFQGGVWEVRTFPLSDQEGSVSGVIRLAADITEKTRLREENLRAGRLAALGELSAGVAHEINNPNGLILMSLPTLRDVFADVRTILDAYHVQQGDFDLAGVSYRTMREEIPLLLEEMTDGARRVKRIVEDLKNFVRREKADEEERFDLNDAVQRALRLVAYPLEKCTDAVNVELAKAPLMVCGISARIEQVLVNLILNSCQASTGPSRRLWVRTRIDAENHVVAAEVEDEGQGISSEDLPRITDPFFTTRRREGGTGLGLSVSSRIVREHQGNLKFSSRPGQGTRVVLTLPLADEEVDFDG